MLQNKHILEIKLKEVKNNRYNELNDHRHTENAKCDFIIISNFNFKTLRAVNCKCLFCCVLSCVHVDVFM